MLLIVTVGLVIVALVLLLFGFAENSLVYIYLSILCSVVAAVVLTIFTRVSRRRALGRARGTVDHLFEPPAAPGEPTTAPAIEPRPDEHGRASPGPEAPTSVTDAVPPQPGRVDRRTILPPVGVAADPGATGRPEERMVFAPPGQAGAPPGELGQRPTRPQPIVGPEMPPPADDAPREPVGIPGGMPGGWEDGDWDDEEVVFPIEDYDRLRVPEILPLLGELDADELEEVRAREITGRARGTLIKRIDMLLASFSALPEGASEPADPTTPLAADTSDLRAQPEPAEAVAYPEPPGRAGGAGAGAAFPIPGYDGLRPSEILPRLTELNPEQLDSVAAHEREGLRRRTILVRISRLQAKE